MCWIPRGRCVRKACTSCTATVASRCAPRSRATRTSTGYSSPNNAARVTPCGWRCTIFPTPRILVLYGDVPLLRAETLTELVRTHAELAVLATELDDPSGYGRVLRDGLGRVRAIVEEKDADEAQREV